jgi:hypothetical protein
MNHYFSNKYFEVNWNQFVISILCLIVIEHGQLALHRIR